MRGLSALLRKELLEAARTWRLWVLPGILAFLGLTSPVLAQLTPALLGSLAAGQPGVVIQIPPPTYLDAYGQWLKNLSQVALFAIILTSAGALSGEKKSGTALLVLTKPVSRAAFVAAKVLAGLLLLASGVLLGAALCWGVTRALFGAAPLAAFAAGSALWLAYGALVTCVMALFSAAIDGQAGAAGAGVALYALSSAAGLWGPALRYSPAGLTPAATAALAGAPAEALWPLVTGLLLALAATAAAAWVFSKREL